MKKKLVSLALGLSLISPLVIANPANAQNIGDELLGVADRITGLDISGLLAGEYWNFLTGLAERVGIREGIIADISAGLEQLDLITNTNTIGEIEEAIGVLGRIDISDINEGIDAAELNSNTGITKSQVKRVVIGQVAAGYSDSIFSLEAQENTLEEQERVSEAVLGIEELHREAEAEVITQNVVKRLTQQNALLGTVYGQIYTTNQELQEGLAINATLLSEDLQQQTIEEATRNAAEQNLLGREAAVTSFFANGL